MYRPFNLMPLAMLAFLMSVFAAAIWTTGPRPNYWMAGLHAFGAILVLMIVTAMRRG